MHVETTEEGTSGSESAEDEDALSVDLPTDCLLQIMRGLDKRTLAAFALSCKRWNTLCSVQSIWQHRFMVRLDDVGTNDVCFFITFHG